MSDADEEKASAVPDAAAAAGARPARGCADRAEPSGAAGHRTDSDQAVLQPATKHVHDFLNSLSKLTGGSKDQGLAFNQAIVKLLQDPKTESYTLVMFLRTQSKDMEKHRLASPWYIF